MFVETVEEMSEKSKKGYKTRKCPKTRFKGSFRADDVEAYFDTIEELEGLEGPLACV